MQWLAALSVRRPVFATVLILSLTVVGLFSFTQLGVDRYPKIDFPTVAITTIQPGAAPEQIETEVSDKIEEAVNTISGIDELRSVSSEGVSQVIVSFLLDKNTDVAAQEVRDKVNGVMPRLPKTIRQPRVDRFDPDSAPVLSLALTANKPARDISEYADKVLRRQLESVRGVGQVLILGGRQRQINIWLDADRLRAYNLTVTDISRALQAQNVETPGGRIDQGPQTMTLRTLGRIETLTGFGDVVVRNGDGHAVRVGDVARVEDGQADADTIANVNGEDAVVLEIRRQSGTNTVEVARDVKARIAEVTSSLPQGYDLRIVRDTSEFIEASIDSIQEHLIVGSVLAALVVLLFLTNLRSTIIAAIAIPTSIVATFGLIWYMGFTLNSLTMLALTLSVGIVIDDAIVVLENIYRFIEEKKQDPFTAAVEATREIGLAVLATTLSLVAIFVPVAFMSGIVGRFMKSFGLTMAFAILVSMLVSFTLTPMLAARWLTKNPSETVRSKDSRIFRAIDLVYTRLLEWSMSHRAIVAGVAAVVLVSSVPLFQVTPMNFIPNDDQSEFEINLRAPEGTSLASTEILANRIATQVRERLSEAEYTLVTVAGDPAGTRNLASVYVRLKPVNERARDQFEAMDLVRSELLPTLGAGLRTSVQPPASIGGGGAQAAEIQFVVNGPDLRTLDTIGQQLFAKVKAIPGVVDLDTSMNVGKPELSVRIDREKAAELGVQIADAAEALRLLVGGDQVTTYNEAGDQYEVHLRARVEDRDTEAALAGLTVPSTRLGSVGLDDIADFAPGSTPTDINRLGRQRQVTIYCNLRPGTSQATVQNAIQAEFDRLRPGPEYRGAFAGRSKELARASESFVIAFALSLVFMYLILAAQFESWLHPVTILLSLPLTLPFALLSIIAFGQSLNVFSALGLLVLFGVVKKNSILQIDHANQLRATGLSAQDAVIRASRDRLRPILMTTFAFVAGMIPLMVSSGVGAGTNRAIGFVIFGGQTLALLLTLLVTPVAYSLLHDASKVRAFRRRAVPATVAVLFLALLASPAGAEQAASTLPLTVDAELAMALEHNVDLAVDRFDPRISDTQVATARSAFRPVLDSGLQRNNQLQPPTNFLIPTSTRTDVISSSVALSQRLPRFGTSYSIAWDSSHASSNSILNSYNPLLRSGLSLNISQPLLRNFSTDAARLQRTVSARNRDIADVTLGERVVQTTAAVKSAYWNLYSALATVDARQASLTLAEELARINRVKVEAGQSPPLDLTSAQAEVAANQEQLIVAETAVRQAEDRLRLLIFDPTVPEAWRVTITPIDAPPVVTLAVDLEAAVTTALRDRSDLVRARGALENASSSLQYSGNQQLPDVRLTAGYQANGLGGTEVLRTGGFPGTIAGAGQVTAFSSVLDQVIRTQYPTWTVGLSVSYPLGASAEQAAYARSQLERAQAETRIKSAEGRVIQQVREAGWKIEMNAKRIDVARTARSLAEQRFDAEQRRFDVGLSTNFLVIQAQRDLSQARTNELSAILAYDLALVEFEAVQQAPPGQGGQPVSAPATSGASGLTPRPSTQRTPSTVAIGLPGVTP